MSFAGYTLALERFSLHLMNFNSSVESLFASGMTPIAERATEQPDEGSQPQNHQKLRRDTKEQYQKG